jgi:hypothetical protein
VPKETQNPQTGASELFIFFMLRSFCRSISRFLVALLKFRQRLLPFMILIKFEIAYLNLFFFAWSPAPALRFKERASSS